MQLKATKETTWKEAISLVGQQYGVDFDQVTGFKVMINFATKQMVLYRDHGQAKLEIDLSDLELVASRVPDLPHSGFYDSKLSVIPCLGLGLDNDGDFFDVVLLSPTPNFVKLTAGTTL